MHLFPGYEPRNLLKKPMVTLKQVKGSDVNLSYMYNLKNSLKKQCLVNVILHSQGYLIQKFKHSVKIPSQRKVKCSGHI